MKEFTVIIPSLNPDEKLLGVVTSLEALGVGDIIIVNDGSKSECLRFFPGENEHPSCTILTHGVNRGKGAALKTAFDYYLKNRPDSQGVITADADGQHSAEDIVKCAEAMLIPDKKTLRRPVILGSRDFSGKDVPPRSKAGNRITSGVFLLLLGMKISDTQTGLRAIPREYVSYMLDVDGDRYEYETNMLMMLKTMKIPYGEVTIRTIYIDDNKTSHFRPVRDSIRIYSLILKFVLTSIVSWVIDTAAFNVLMLLLAPLTGSLTSYVSVVGARVISSLANFTINKNKVFKNTDKVSSVIVKYYALAIPIMIVSGLTVYLLDNAFSGGNLFLINLIKVAVDVTMYLISFRVQREWVFKSSKNRKENSNEPLPPQ